MNALATMMLIGTLAVVAVTFLASGHGAGVGHQEEQAIESSR